MPDLWNGYAEVVKYNDDKVDTSISATEYEQQQWQDLSNDDEEELGSYWENDEVYESDTYEDNLVAEDSYSTWDITQAQVHDWGVGDGWEETDSSKLEPSSADYYASISYFEAPLGYPFMNWLVLILESAFFDYFQRNLKKELNSIEWKKEHLKDDEGNTDHYMVKLNWNEPDRIDMKWWVIMLRCVDLPNSAYNEPILPDGRPSLTPRQIVLECARTLRNATYDRLEIETHVIQKAVSIPAVLKDQERAALVARVWKVVNAERSVVIDGAYTVINEDPTVDEETRREVHAMLDPARALCTTLLQVHSRILALGEEGCFNRAERGDSNIVGHVNGSSAGDFELRQCAQWPWSGAPLWNPDAHATDFELGGRLVSCIALRQAIFWQLCALRNDVAHRGEMNEESLRWYANLAMLLMILFHEFRIAMEIEVVAEGFLTQKTRLAVLTRLFEAYEAEIIRDLVMRAKSEVICAAYQAEMRRPEVPSNDSSTKLSLTSLSRETRRLENSTSGDSIRSISSEPASTSERSVAGVIAVDLKPKIAHPLRELTSTEVCRLAIDKYVTCESMHECLRYEPYELIENVKETSTGWLDGDPIIDGEKELTDDFSQSNHMQYKDMEVSSEEENLG